MAPNLKLCVQVTFRFPPMLWKVCVHISLHLTLIPILHTMKFDKINIPTYKSWLWHSPGLGAKLTYSIVQYIVLEQFALSEAFTFNYTQLSAVSYAMDFKGLVFR